MVAFSGFVGDTLQAVPRQSQVVGQKWHGRVTGCLSPSLQEEEKKKAKEEEELREHEEYLKLKESFVVEEEGLDEAMTEEEVGSAGPALEELVAGVPGAEAVPAELL